MEYKVISAIERRRAARAFTLIETLVSAAVSGMVLAAVASIFVFSARSFSSLFNYTDLDQASRTALDRMSRDIRSADSLSSFNTDASGNVIQLIFNAAGGANNLVYSYDPVNKILFRTNGTEVTTVLSQCDALAFSVYGSESATNTFDQFPVTNAVNAKLIKVDWTCSRTLMGQKYNTESVQSAKIVLRRP